MPRPRRAANLRKYPTAEVIKTDPLKIFDTAPEVQELIFQHLPERDLIKFSLVSKRWYDNIRKSKAFKSKVLVRIVPKITRRDRSVNHVTKSKKRYKTIKLEDQKLNDEPELTPSKILKRVHLRLFDLNINNLQYFILMKSFASNVIRLHISNIKVRLEHIDPITFANLEILTIVSAVDGTDIIKPFIAKQPKLKYLRIDERQAAVLNHSSDILLLNPTLETLRIKSCNVNWMKHPMPFQLKRLSLLSLEAPLDELSSIYWQKFMQQQGQTLEALTLINWQYSFLLYSLWDSMIHLKKLKLDCGIEESSPLAQNIPLMFPSNYQNIYVNESLEEINIYGCDMSIIPERFLACIFDAAPNLNVHDVRETEIKEE